MTHVATLMDAASALAPMALAGLMALALRWHSIRRIA